MRPRQKPGPFSSHRAEQIPVPRSNALWTERLANALAAHVIIL